MVTREIQEVTEWLQIETGGYRDINRERKLQNSYKQRMDDTEWLQTENGGYLNDYTPLV